MSSHREAPEISKDPVADSTDFYMFRSPDRPSTVTLIANYIPLQHPAGGPNFFEFGDDVIYRINVDHDGDAKAEIVYEFRFRTRVRNKNTFLYNVGPIGSLDAAEWNRPQYYSVTRIKNGKRKELGKNLACPPCNVGPRSTPDYADLATAAIHDLPGGIKVFAGQRLDPFWVDLGAIFDLGGLRPLNEAHLIPIPSAQGVNALENVSVHSIAIQVPIKALTRDGSVPTDVEAEEAVLGAWTSAHRSRGTIRDESGDQRAGKMVQVSRLGNPLFNEVIVPMARKDRWNRSKPVYDADYEENVFKPELAGLLPVLYPGAFPNLSAYTANRADLHAILLTGIPTGVVPGFQNFTGATPADMLRLNVAIPPTPEADVNPLGLVGGDAAGFPNGRRVYDDVVTIELRAVAGLTLPLVDASFTPDAVVGAVADGTTPPPFLDVFPYCSHPVSGYDVTPLGASA